MLRRQMRRQSWRLSWLALAALLESCATGGSHEAASRRSPGSALIQEKAFAPLQLTVPRVGTDIQRRVLPNGIVLYLAADRSVPVVKAYALFRAGNLYEDPAKSGAAQFTASQLRAGGTEAMPPETLNEELEVMRFNRQYQEISAGLAAGASITVIFTEKTLNPGVEIDSQNDVYERNETNNFSREVFAFPTPTSRCLRTPTPDVELIAPLAVMQGHTARVLSVDFSPDGRMIASGSVDNSLRLWRNGEFSLLRTMQGHPFPISTWIFLPMAACWRPDRPMVLCVFGRCRMDSL